MINDKTPHLQLPLPHPDNDLAEDIGPMRDAFGKVDAALETVDAVLKNVDAALAKKADDAAVATGLAKKADDAANTAAHDTIKSDLIASGIKVVSSPVITGQDKAPIGHAAPYVLSAFSGLTGGTAVLFRYTLGTGDEQTVAADTGSATGTATVSITVPEGTANGATLALSATAVDNFGNERTATKSLTASDSMVLAPTVTAPEAGTIVSPVSIPITSSAPRPVGHSLSLTENVVSVVLALRGSASSDSGRATQAGTPAAIHSSMSTPQLTASPGSLPSGVGQRRAVA